MSPLSIISSERKIIAYLATSADGFIARADGDVSWLDRPRPDGGYGMQSFLRSVDTIVMGRKTWEVAQRLGGAMIEGKKNIVLSRSLPAFAAPGGTVENISARDLAKRLREEKGKNVWLMGGAQVFGEFLDAGELDELIVHVVPVLIGTGICLLDATPRTTELKLRSTRKFVDGVVRLHYDLREKASDAATATATD
jgi:dihydrofolate reductase